MTERRAATPREDRPLNDQWKYQIRINLRDDITEKARRDPVLRFLADILARQQVSMTWQFDAFAGYVAEVEKHGTRGHYERRPRNQAHS